MEQPLKAYATREDVRSAVCQGAGSILAVLGLLMAIMVLGWLRGDIESLDSQVVENGKALARIEGSLEEAL